MSGPYGTETRGRKTVKRVHVHLKWYNIRRGGAGSAECHPNLYMRVTTLVATKGAESCQSLPPRKRPRVSTTRQEAIEFRI